MHTHSDPNQVVLVNEQDEQIGVMDKLDAHRGKGTLHRASSVFLFREKDGEWELLMQQRSQYKIVGAHQWANTICGNVRPGETYEECAYRRLNEEIGVTTAVVEPIHKLQYQAYCNPEFSENEMVQIFVGLYDDLIEQNPQEVEGSQWVNWQKLLERKTKNIFEDMELTPWFVEFLSREELIVKINKFLSTKGV